MTGPDVERHRVQPGDRPAAVHQRAARPGSRWARGRSSSTPARSTSTRRPAARSRSSGSSASSRSDGDVRFGAPRAATRGRRAARRPATAVADLHTHTTRSDGVLEPRRARPPGRTTPGVRLLADHRPRQPRRRTASWSRPARRRCPPDLELIPAVEINAVTRGLGPRPVRGRAPRAGDRRGPGGRRVRGRAREPARRPPHRASTRPSSGCASSGCRSTPRSRPSTSPRDDALGRPTVARALVAAGFAESVEDAFRRLLVARPARATCRGRASARSRRSTRSVPRAASRRSRTSGRRRTGSRSCATLIAEGLDGLETPPPLVRRRDARRRSARRRARSASSRPAARTTTATSAPYAEAHAGLVMPDALVAGLRTRLASTRRARSRSTRGPGSASVAACASLTNVGWSSTGLAGWCRRRAATRLRISTNTEKPIAA